MIGNIVKKEEKAIIIKKEIKKKEENMKNIMIETDLEKEIYIGLQK